MARPVPRLTLATQKPRRLSAFAASALAHGLAFGGVVIAALGAAGSLPEPTGTVVLLPLPEITPPPPPPGPPSGVRRPPSRTATVRPPDAAFEAPSETPSELPPPEEISLPFTEVCTGTCVPGGNPFATRPSGPIVSGLGDGPGVEAPPPARPPRVSEIHGPRKVHHVPPVYPQIAILARVEGRVVIDCLITEDGRIGEVTVLDGNSLLVPAAVDAVRQWVYTPTLVSGIRSAVLMTVTVNFALRR